MALSNKRRVFVEEYLQCWNATEAARRAGYKNPNKMGPRLVKVGIVEDLIQERITEKLMSADEVLIRLGAQARSSITDVIQPLGKTFIVPIDEVMEYGHLIKKIKHTKNGIEIELYSSQRALELIGKSHALFTDRIEGKLELGVDKIIIELKPDGRTESRGDRITPAA